MSKHILDKPDTSADPASIVVKHFLRLARESNPDGSTHMLFRRAQQRADARLAAYTQLDRGRRA